jgi:hypothetical protein
LGGDYGAAGVCSILKTRHFRRAFPMENAPEKWSALETPLTVSLRSELLRDDHRPFLQFADL